MDEKTEEMTLQETVQKMNEEQPYQGFLSPFVSEILDMFAQGMSMLKIANTLNERVQKETGRYLNAALIRYVLKRHGYLKIKQPRYRSEKRQPAPVTSPSRAVTEGWVLVAEMDGEKLTRIIARSPYRPLATDVTNDVLALLKDALLRDLFSKKRPVEKIIAHPLSGGRRSTSQ
jgi:hypothetical protein